MLRQFLRLADGINKWSGRTVAWLVWVVMAICVFEVIARRFFGSPHVWSYDIINMFYALHFMLLFGYCLLERGHVSIDILSSMLPRKIQSLLLIITYLAFFFPFVVVLFYVGLKSSLSSWEYMERTSVGLMYVTPIMKTAVPVSALLLFIQGIPELIRLILFVKGDESNV